MRNVTGRNVRDGKSHDVFHDALGGAEVAGTAGRLLLADALATFPVALLEVR
jgi:hypothetical protein